MIRILYISHSFPLAGDPLTNVGGMQRVAMELHSALREHPGIWLRSRVLETRWESTGRRMVPFMAGMLVDLPRQVRRERIDVVLFSSMVTASVVALLAPRLRAAGALTAAIPVGRDVTLPNAVYQRLVPRVLRSLDRVFPISRATGEACLARGLEPGRMEVIPCGVDLARFEPPGGQERDRAGLDAIIAIRQLPDLPREARLLFSVGRHQERKGFHWFAEHVLPLLPRETVYLVGGEGPMTSAIQQAAERAGVIERVWMMGRLTEAELTTLYRASDLFIMPNIPVVGDMEGFGVVMLEAGASGLPIVAADLEGIRDVIQPRRNGVLVPSGDAEAFANAVHDYVGDPPRLRSASQAAVDFTRERFGWSAIAERFHESLIAALG